MKEFSCQYIGGVEERGTVVRRDLLLTIEGKDYVLSVATPSFIQSLKEYNRPFDEEMQFDENILPMENVMDLKIVIEKLKQMFQEDIEPYLEQIKTTPHLE